MSEKAPVVPESGKQRNDLLRQITQGPGLVSILGVIVALVIGGLLIAVTDEKVGETAGYLFAQPSAFFSEFWRAATESYVALFN
ncbi:MAG: ABC transporter permease, partial [Glutamicibacter arilaitensis]